MPTALAPASQNTRTRPQARLLLLGPEALAALAPQLRPRVSVPLVPTRNAAPTDRNTEDRAMVALTSVPVRDGAGRTVAMVVGGLLLNQNLDFIDHINRIVYPDGSLPFGSQGTATLFLDDVRITTNVRLFQDQRAIGTRVSQTVRDRVLGQGQTWLARAFVVNDWYVSAYEPLLDAAGQRIGMLYVGFLEQPFRLVRYALLAVTGLIFLLAMAVSAWFSLRWARSIFKPVEQMNRTMQQVEDGEAHARVGGLPAHDELGALAGHLDQLLDVIDDKTRALQRWGDELDLKVAERTQALEASNASLQMAQQQLVKSEKLAAIGQLTASIAHEVNNPIAVMQGNLDLMRETLGPQGAAVRDELRLMDEQIERMRLIVTQLLQYARPTEYAGYTEALDANRLVEDCLVLVQHLLAKTGIEVKQDLLRAAHGRLQPAGAAADRDQPADQRHPGHARGWRAAAEHTRPAGRCGAHRGRLRPRSFSLGDGAAVPPVFHHQERRQRPGPVDQRGAGRALWRQSGGEQPQRWNGGRHLHPQAAQRA